MLVALANIACAEKRTVCEGGNDGSPRRSCFTERTLLILAPSSEGCALLGSTLVFNLTPHLLYKLRGSL